MNKLPLHILLEIMEESQIPFAVFWEEPPVGTKLNAVFSLVVALSKLGKFSLTHQVEFQRILSTRTEDQFGNIRYYLNRRYHRPEEDGPALIYTDVSRSWYRFGKPHRVNGPAIEHSCGSVIWM
jgi:hypothetical protein